MEERRTIDLYCERIDPSFWSEPVNALSNGAFLMVALLAYLSWRAMPARDMPALMLIGLLCAIGLGSFAFHTLATTAAAVADVVPITVFILVYLVLAARRFLDLPMWQAVIISAGYLPVALTVNLVLGPVLKGSASYVPALMAMLIFAILTLRHDRATSRGLFLAGGLFALSLTARTLDTPLCAALPLGTHFLWHLLNACVLYILLIPLMARYNDRNRNPQAFQ